MKAKQLGLELDRGATVAFRAFEAEAYARGFVCVAGLDEAGRGPLAGPVVAAAVVMPRGFTHDEIRDSKLLTAKQRERLSAVIEQTAICWGIGIVEADEIDRVNILRASLMAMVKAQESLEPKADCLLIDGNQAIPAELFSNGVLPRTRSIQQKTIVKGDQLCISIAAASIVAKVTRDRLMVDYDRMYPDYGFALHKGYTCAAHLAALRRHGPSPIHRQSFKPVREAVQPR